MKHMPEQELERLLDRELKQMPERTAPPTLLHRVMLEVHQRQRQPWWKRAWPEWPRQLQVWSLVVLVAVVGLAAVASGQWNLGVADTPAFLALREKLTAAWRTMEALGGAGETLFRALFRHFLIWGFVGLGAAYLAAIGLFSACFRLSWQRA